MQSKQSVCPSVECRKTDSLAARQAADRQSRLTKPAGALGELERIAIMLAGHQGRECPRVERPEIFVFAADHGVAAQGVSAYPQSVTAQMVHNFLAGGAAVSVLAKLHDARLTVVDMGVADLQVPEHPAFLARPCNTSGTRDFTREPAMTHNELQHAMAAGRECVELALSRGCDIFIAGEMGIGNTTAASAVACALLGKPAAELVGLGTGISNQTRLHKCALVDKALALHAQTLACLQTISADPDAAAVQVAVNAATPSGANLYANSSADPVTAGPADCAWVLRPEQALEALRCLGGYEIAAITGAALACAQHGLTMLVDGFIVSVAALVACAVQPDVRDWMLFAHQSAEAGHNAVLTALGAQALLKLDMRLGEGSGAALALALLKAACELHGGMATFAQAGVDERTGGTSAA